MPQDGRRSVGGCPDDRENIVAILSRGPPEIGVDAPRPELGGRMRKGDIGSPRLLGDADPAGADFDSIGPNAIVGLHIARLAAVGAYLDRCLDRKRYELAHKALLDAAADDADARHVDTPADLPGTIPGVQPGGSAA